MNPRINANLFFLNLAQYLLFFYNLNLLSLNLIC